MLKLEAMPAQMPKNPRIGHGLFLLGILVDLDQGVIGLTTSASHACMRPLTALAQASQAMRPATSTGRRSHTQELLFFGLRGFIREHHKAGREIPYCRMEKLCNLEQLPPNGFTVARVPHKIKSGPAGWTRAVAPCPYWSGYGSSQDDCGV